MIDDNGLAIPEGEEPINEMKREALTSKIAGLQNIADRDNTDSRYSALVNDLLSLIPSYYYHAASENGNEAITEQLRLMAEDSERYRWAIEVCENSGTLDSIVLCHEGNVSKIRERTDLYRNDERVAVDCNREIKNDFIDGEISPEMIDAGAESIYGHPREKAIEWAKEEKFNSCANTAIDAYKAMRCAALKSQQDAAIESQRSEGESS
jgi:hypothetical protein